MKTNEIGFHAGELAAQEAAGVRREAARLEGMLAPALLGASAASYLATQQLVALTARDRDDRLWVSALFGEPGFIEVVDERTMRIASAPSYDDPLHGLPAGQPVGSIVLDHGRRRRLRVNGTLTAVGPNFLEVSVDQAFGNCPQHIPRRLLEPWSGGGPDVDRSTRLTEHDRDLVRSVDSFIVGTTHPDRGNDASHRGGEPGFVHVEDDRIWWPDFAGNNMFTTAGNLLVDPEVALLFTNPEAHDALHVHGRGRTETTATGRRTVVDVDDVRRSVLPFEVSVAAA